MFNHRSCSNSDDNITTAVYISTVFQVKILLPNLKCITAGLKRCLVAPIGLHIKEINSPAKRFNVNTQDTTESR